MIDKMFFLLFSSLWSVARALPAHAKALFLIYFSDFRVVEFTAAVGAAFAAVNEFCARIGIPDAKAHQIALFGAAIAAFCFIRNPKTKDWSTEPDGDATQVPSDNETAPGAGSAGILASGTANQAVYAVEKSSTRVSRVIRNPERGL